MEMSGGNTWKLTQRKIIFQVWRLGQWDKLFPRKENGFIILYQELQRVRAYNTMWVGNELEHTKTTVSTLWSSLLLWLVHYWCISQTSHTAFLVSTALRVNSAFHVAKNIKNPCASKGSQDLKPTLQPRTLLGKFSVSTPQKNSTKAEVQGWKTVNILLLLSATPALKDDNQNVESLIYI